MVERNIEVDILRQEPVPRGPVELVERKGIGHPDTVADGLAEAVSRSLSELYIQEAGEILHHNVDKNEVSGGQSEPRWGGGEVLEPAYIILLGRAIDEINSPSGKKRLPVKGRAIKAAKRYLVEVLNCPMACDIPQLDVEKNVIVDSRMGRGSSDLLENFARSSQQCTAQNMDSSCRPANDTSFGVGFSPLSETERLTLEIERYINGSMKNDLKATGKDVKVMAYRRGEKISLTVACAMIDRFLADAHEYVSVVEQMKKLILDRAAALTEREVSVTINHADNYQILDESGYYLTVTGLSLENGDDGAVGRGNRANGLITPFRPMSLEAVAGKNPVTHVGKLYNILASQIAVDIAAEAGDEIEEVRVRLLSQIGSPIDHPEVASIQLYVTDESTFPRWRTRARDVADIRLAGIERLTKDILSVPWAELSDMSTALGLTYFRS